MNYRTYLKEHIHWFGLFLFITLTADIFLFTLKGSFYLALYISLSLFFAYFLGTYLDYRTTKDFLKELSDTEKALDQKYLLGEMDMEPATQEQKLTKEILREMGQSMTEQVSSHRRQNEEYREYIETWVHEVKIPISTARMIAENHGSMPLKKTGMEDEIDRIASCVEQALFYARSKAVEKDYVIGRVNLESVVKSTLVTHKRALIALHSSIDLNGLTPSAEVLSDSKWLSFILSQLINNSIKYRKEDVPLSLTFSAQVSDGRTVLSLTDNGIGICTSDLERVFEKGFTGYNGRAYKASTGFGLYLCKKLCDRLQHEISISSTQGEGCTVSIIF